MNNSVSSTTIANALSNLTKLASQQIISNLTTPIPIHNETKPSIPDAIHGSKGSAEEEHSFSMAIFFVLSVIAAAIMIIHLILRYKINYLPESLAVVLTGVCIGLAIKLSPSKN